MSTILCICLMPTPRQLPLYLFNVYPTSNILCICLMSTPLYPLYLFNVYPMSTILCICLMFTPRQLSCIYIPEILQTYGPDAKSGLHWFGGQWSAVWRPSVCTFAGHWPLLNKPRETFPGLATPSRRCKNSAVVGVDSIDLYFF